MDIPTDAELGLKPLDLKIDPIPTLEELGIHIDLGFDPTPYLWTGRLR